MFEEFYTTKMSPEKKSLENRFSKILGKGGKISKIAIIVTTSLLVIGAVSVSVVLAAFDTSERKKADETTEKTHEYDAVKANDDGGVEIEKVVVYNDTQENAVDAETHAEMIDYRDEDQADGTATLVFVNPVEGEVEINTPFGTQKNPVTGNVTYHNGVDIAVQEGDTVLSAIDGIVKEAQFNSSLGNYILVENGKYSTISAHLSSVDVKQGDEVFAGQKIGKAGKSGMTTGPNLHFEFKVGENYADPEALLVKSAQQDKKMSPEQVVAAYYSHFAEADHNGMMQYCTENFIEKRFRDNTVGGKIRAELVSMTPVRQEDSRGIHFVVSSKNLTEGKTYGVVSDGIYYTLLNVGGEWKIDSWYLKEDFEKIYG